MKRGMVAICLLSNLALLQAGELEIGEKWKTTPEYVEYSKLDPNSQIAKKLKEDTITRLTNESLKIYLDSFDVKFRNLMEKKVEELPIGLKGLLGNMNIKIKEELTHNYDSMTISKINTFMFNFVDSIYKEKGTAQKNISELPKIAPELVNSKNISYLVDVGKNYDEAVKSQEKADEANKERIVKNADEIFKKLKPFINPKRSVEDLEKIQTALKSYIKSKNEYDGKALSNLMIVETIAPEIKVNSKWEYKSEIETANFADKASKIDKNIDTTILECEMMIKQHTTKLAEVKKDSEISKYLKEAIDYRQKVISNLKINKIDDARFNYYIAQRVESTIKSVENAEAWKRIGEILENIK